MKEALILNPVLWVSFSFMAVFLCFVSGAGELCPSGWRIWWAGHSHWRWGRLRRVPICHSRSWRWGHRWWHYLRDRWDSCVRDDSWWRQRGPQLLSSSNPNQDGLTRWANSSQMCHVIQILVWHSSFLHCFILCSPIKHISTMTLGGILNQSPSHLKESHIIWKKLKETVLTVEFDNWICDSSFPWWCFIFIRCLIHLYKLTTVVKSTQLTNFSDQNLF